MWKDNETDFFEWVFAYEIDSDWEAVWIGKRWLKS
jgi:hypothetical protein